MGKWGKADEHGQVGGKMMCYVKRWFLNTFQSATQKHVRWGGGRKRRERGQESKKTKED